MNLVFLIVYLPLKHSTHTSNGPYEELDRFMFISLEFEFISISEIGLINEQSVFFN